MIYRCTLLVIASLFILSSCGKKCEVGDIEGSWYIRDAEANCAQEDGQPYLISGNNFGYQLRFQSNGVFRVFFGCEGYFTYYGEWEQIDYNTINIKIDMFNTSFDHDMDIEWSDRDCNRWSTSWPLLEGTYAGT